jgi:hypothetical protein
MSTFENNWSGIMGAQRRAVDEKWGYLEDFL